MSKPIATPLSREELVAALDSARTVGAEFPDRLLQAMSANSLDDLPDGLKKIFNSFKAGMDNFLSKLPPTEQIPAALDAGWTLNQVSDMFRNTISLWSAITERFGDFERSQNEITSAASRNAVTAMEAKIAAEYILKTIAASEAEAAAKTAVDAYKAQCALVAGRQEGLSKNGLPPAPDAIVLLPDPEYQSEVAASATRVQKLAGAGVSLNTHPESVRLAAWDDDECARVLRVAAECAAAQQAAAQKAQSHNTAPGRAPINPLVGGGTPPPATRKVVGA